MRRHTFWIALACLLLTTLACTIPVPTVEPLTIIEPVNQVESLSRLEAERANVRLRLLSESLIVRPSTEANLLQGRFHYNVQEWEPNIRQESRADGELTVVTIGQGVGSQIPLGRSDEYFNAWEIDLNRGIPIDLDINMGAGTTQLDLSGLMLSNLNVTSGSADLSLVINEANPIPMSAARFTSGTGNYTIAGLGNANFDRMIITGGAGSMDLDFNGAWTRGAIVEVRAGAGRVTLRVPEAVGVRITFSSTPISTVDAFGLTEQTENVYVNGAYGVAPVTLTINVTAGIGAITLISQ